MRLTAKRRRFLIEGLSKSAAFQSVWDTENNSPAEFKAFYGLTMDEGRKALEALVQSIRLK